MIIPGQFGFKSGFREEAFVGSNVKLSPAVAAIEFHSEQKTLRL